MPPHLNLCKSRPCLFFKSRFEYEEFSTQQLGENAPETADLYFSYGRALLENAIVQSSVLGKEQREDGIQEDNKGNVVFLLSPFCNCTICFSFTASGSGSGGTNAPILSFSGDAEDMDASEDHAVDLFGQAAAAVEVEETAAEAEESEEEEDGEPEDDFNAAWEVLDLARAIYDKQKDENNDEEVRLKLADTYIALGDVSLETGLFFFFLFNNPFDYFLAEKFDQAITDYEVGLELKIGLLPTSSRHIAEAHYKLSMVLDLTSGRLSDAIIHVQKALESVESRLAELRDGLAGQLPPLPPQQADNDKGKSKSSGRLVRDDYVQNMSKTQIENEIKELHGLRDDLELKVS